METTAKAVYATTADITCGRDSLKYIPDKDIAKGYIGAIVSPEKIKK